MVPVLVCSSENWALNIADTGSAETAKLKYLREVSGHGLCDHECSNTIRDPFGIFNLEERMQ
jgi:hypothetical protein